MIDLNDIHSLSDFQRNTKEHIERLKKTGKPEVLTVNGKAEVIIQAATSYQELLDTIDRLESIAGIRGGLKEVEQGQFASAKEVFKRMRIKQKIPGRS